MTQSQHYVVVPLDPDPEMLVRGGEEFFDSARNWISGDTELDQDYADDVYTAMIAAAPPPPEQVLSDEEIQSLWGEACNDSPSKPGWCRHIRYARAIERALFKKLGAKNDE